MLDRFVFILGETWKMWSFFNQLFFTQVFPWRIFPPKPQPFIETEVCQRVNPPPQDPGFQKRRQIKVLWKPQIYGEKKNQPQLFTPGLTYRKEPSFLRAWLDHWFSLNKPGAIKSWFLRGPRWGGLVGWWAIKENKTQPLQQNRGG